MRYPILAFLLICLLSLSFGAIIKKQTLSQVRQDAGTVDAPTIGDTLAAPVENSHVPELPAVA